MEYLEPARHTFRNSSGREEVDSWQNGDEQDEHEGWTGYTVFYLRDEAAVSRIVVSLNGLDYEEMVTTGLGIGQGSLHPSHRKGHRGRMKMLAPSTVCCDKASSLTAALVKMEENALAMHLRC